MVEEEILFPLLAQYMPQFGKTEGSGNHFELHHAIHEGGSDPNLVYDLMINL
jgi:hypothetical protein